MLDMLIAHALKLREDEVALCPTYLDLIFA